MLLLLLLLLLNEKIRTLRPHCAPSTPTATSSPPVSRSLVTRVERDIAFPHSLEVKQDQDEMLSSLESSPPGPECVAAALKGLMQLPEEEPQDDLGEGDLSISGMEWLSPVQYKHKGKRSIGSHRESDKRGAKRQLATLPWTRNLFAPTLRGRRAEEANPESVKLEHRLPWAFGLMMPRLTKRALEVADEGAL